MKPIAIISQTIAITDLVLPKMARQRIRNILCYDVVKEVWELVGAFVLLILFSPLMLVIAVVIKLTSAGPAILKQKRLTSGGEIFTMYKFRTMCDNAEAETGEVWAKPQDSRVTPVGKVLRSYRLDELPQLVNVLNGEMSLIGPRPERPDIAERLTKQLPRFKDRLSVKAGITGLAQVRIGYSSSLRHYRRKVEMDLIYIKNRCLFLDLKIAMRTLLVVFCGSGMRW